MKKSLYQIESQYINLVSEIEEMEGEITSEQIEALKITKNELQSKSIAYLSVISTRESENAQIDAELKRLQSIKKANNNVIERLKTNLLDAVNIFGAFEVGLSKFGIRKSKKLEVLDESKISSEYMNSKLTVTPNKAEITKAIKNGVFVDGVQLVECKNLKIN
jgi:hypothetical protein